MSDMMEHISALRVDVRGLKEKVRNNTEDIADHKEEVKDISKKLTIVIIIMCVNAAISSASNLPKLISVFGL